MAFYSVFLWLTLLPPTVLCDYRLEVELMQYTGTGRLDDGSCCDLELGGSTCSGSETCDVEFIFSIRNIGDPAVSLASLTKGAGRYNDMNVINFGNCELFPTTTSVAAVNPLTFDVPTGDWSSTDTLRVTIGARDYDPPAGASTAGTFEEVGSPFLDIIRPSAPSETFGEAATSSDGAAMITYRYRVICTDGSCGNDCSQTTDCQSWSPACDGIGTPATQPPRTQPSSSTNPCISSPCLNGGTCMPIAPGEFMCDCTSEYQGATCADLIGGSQPTDPPGTATEPSTELISGTLDDTKAPGNSATTGSRAPTYWLYTVTGCIITLIIGTFNIL